MHSAIQNIVNELDQLANTVLGSIPSDEPFNIAHNNWTFPGITRSELAEHVRSLSTLIKERDPDALGQQEQRIIDCARSLTYLRNNTVPNIWSNPALVIPAFYLTIEGLRETLKPVLANGVEISDDASRLAAKVRARARAVDARLSDIEPRSEKLSSMVARIESAYEAADQLPTDLEQLAQGRERVVTLLREVEADRAAVLSAKTSANEFNNQLLASAEEAATVLKQCHSAYAAATSQGLATAFAERSKALDRSMWYWVAGFVIALVLGGYFGSTRLQELSELMKSPNLTIGSAILNLLLAILSFGAPIWFSWLATKQIGQRFRLSEDYAFKAAVSQAYEGYRREAARFDKDMEARLLASALTRLDEQPLRFVEHHSHGSPWHELANSELVKKAVNSIPGFGEKISDAAKDALSTIRAASLTPKETPKLVSDTESK